MPKISEGTEVITADGHITEVVDMEEKPVDQLPEDERIEMFKEEKQSPLLVDDEYLEEIA